MTFFFFIHKISVKGSLNLKDYNMDIFWLISFFILKCQICHIFFFELHESIFIQKSFSLY